MPQTVLPLRDDDAKVRRVTDAHLDSSERFNRVDWLEHCSVAVQQLRNDPRNDPEERAAAILVNLFLPDSRGLDASIEYSACRPIEGPEPGQLHVTCRDRSISTGRQ